MKKVYIKFVDEQKNAATEQICDATGVVSNAVLQLYVTRATDGYIIINFPLCNILHYTIEHVGE